MSAIFEKNYLIESFLPIFFGTKSVCGGCKVELEFERIAEMLVKILMNEKKIIIKIKI